MDLNDLTEESAAEFIHRRRLQIVIHSCIYYRFDQNLISDHQWAEWAKELVAAQKRFPQVAEKQLWAKEFADFDGSTGYHLPIHDTGVVKKAWNLIEMNKEVGE